MSATVAPALSVRGLRKAYKDVVAVDGLDLEVRPGECFGLLGPNGAGKTTTIEICEGLTPPDAGEVLAALPGGTLPAVRALVRVTGPPACRQAADGGRGIGADERRHAPDVDLLRRVLFLDQISRCRPATDPRAAAHRGDRCASRHHAPGRGTGP